MSDRSNAWWDGYSSYLSDLDRDDNPYFTNQRDRDDWYDGWDRAASDN